MKSKILSTIALVFVFLISTSVNKKQALQQFQAKAYYFSKSKMDLGKWGARLSEAQKKEVDLAHSKQGKSPPPETLHRQVFLAVRHLGESFQ